MVVVRDTAGNRIKVPDSWPSCSTAIFQRIIADWEPEKEIKDRSRLRLFSIMIDKPIEEVSESTDPGWDDALWECTRFVYAEAMDFTRLPVPKKLAIAGVTVGIPRDLGRMTLGQNTHVKLKMASVTDLNSIISFAIAVYLQPAIDGAKFDYHRALEIEQAILAMPITVTYPVGFFFLKRLDSSGRSLTRRLSRLIARSITNARLLLNSRKLKDLLRTLPCLSLSSTPNASAWIPTWYGKRNLTT